MNLAKILAWGGLLSAALLTAGFPRCAGIVMVIANVIVIGSGMLKKEKPAYAGLDSPAFTSKELKEFSERNYERKARLQAKVPRH